MSLYRGMGPPYLVRIVVRASADFDPVAVAAAAPTVTMRVTKTSGAAVDWSAAIVSSGVASLTVEHALAVSDLDEKGRYTVWLRFLMPDASVLRTEVGKLVVLDTNQALG